MIFNLPPICGLFPLLLYIVLSFRNSRQRQYLCCCRRDSG